ncbi:hypothetical protein [Celeribacter arenosi]
MTNLDPQAVLASVRRLVSETRVDQSDAFVLSPALRIDDAAQNNPTSISEPLVLSADQAVKMPETLEATEVPTEWSPAYDDTPNADAVAHAAHMTLEERIAELESAVGAQLSDWEPDGSEDLTEEIPQEVPRAFAETGARVLRFQSAPDRGADTPQAVVEPTKAPQADKRVFDSARVEDIRAAALDAARRSAQDAAASSIRNSFSDTGLEDDELMDEEALRDFVAQVIREELQGALGERITRNVRRLVRREVQRALALREFD